MKLRHRSHFALAMLLCSTWLADSVAYSALANRDLTQAKQAAEAKGYIFENSHDEIVAKARKEGRVRVLTTQRNLKPLANAFRKKYPFIDLRIEEVPGTDTHQRTRSHLGVKSRFLMSEFGKRVKRARMLSGG